MNKYFLLYKTLRKCDVSASSDNSLYADKTLPLSLVVEIVLILCAMGGVGYLGYAFAGMLELFGGVSVVFSVLALLTGCVVAVKGLIQLINSLYMSTDTTLLITMPVSPLMLATVRLANVLSASSRRLSGRALAKLYRAKSPVASYQLKELRLLRRNSAYLLKDFFIAFGWPLILIPLVLISRLNATPMPDGSGEEMEAFGTALTSDATLLLVLTLGIVCAAILFLNMFNDLAYSSITREGDTFSVLKQLPISLRDQIRAKRNVARTVVGISTIGYLTVAALVGVILGVIPWYVIPYSLSVGIPLLCLVVDIDMISGIRHANLHWDNEATAIKKNAGLILGSYLLAVLIIIGLVFLYIFLKKHDFLALPCLLAVPLPLAALAALADRRMYAAAEKKLGKL